MLHYALVFLVVALIAGLLGVTGVASVATNIAYVLFVVALVEHCEQVVVHQSFDGGGHVPRCPSAVATITVRGRAHRSFVTVLTKQLDAEGIRCRRAGGVSSTSTGARRALPIFLRYERF